MQPLMERNLSSSCGMSVLSMKIEWNRIGLRACHITLHMVVSSYFRDSTHEKNSFPDKQHEESGNVFAKSDQNISEARSGDSCTVRDRADTGGIIYALAAASWYVWRWHDTLPSYFGMARTGYVASYAIFSRWPRLLDPFLADWQDVQ